MPGNRTVPRLFVAGLIERNVIIESIGYNVQIKRQIERPTVPGMEAESATIIRHNVFVNLPTVRAEWHALICWWAIGGYPGLAPTTLT